MILIVSKGEPIPLFSDTFDTKYRAKNFTDTDSDTNTNLYSYHSKKSYGTWKICDLSNNCDTENSVRLLSKLYKLCLLERRHNMTTVSVPGSI